MKTATPLLFILLMSTLACGQNNAPCRIEHLFGRFPALNEIGYTQIAIGQIYSLSRQDRKKYEMDKADVLCFIVKDSTELGEYYSHPAMDDPSFIISGYAPYHFYVLYRLKSADGCYPIVYNENRDEWNCTYLSVFSHDGVLQDKIPVHYEEVDQYFSCSLVHPDDWSVLKVTYKFLADKDWSDDDDSPSSIIETEFYQFDFAQKKFIRKHTESKTSRVFYFRFARDDKYYDDPFSRDNMEETKEKFRQLISKHTPIPPPPHL